MARPLDVHQLRELAAFVNDLASLGGYVTTADLARDAGYQEPNLSRVRNAKADISGYNLFKLIRAVARRVDDTVEGAAAATASGRLTNQAVADRLDELADLTDAMHRMIEEGRRPLSGEEFVTGLVADAAVHPYSREALRELGRALVHLADDADHHEEPRHGPSVAGGSAS